MDIDKQIDDEIFRSKEEKDKRERYARLQHEKVMRDDIAIRVLIAMVETAKPDENAQRSVDRISDMARTAYRFADAMLAARAGERKAAIEEIVKVLQTPINSIDIKSTISREDESAFNIDEKGQAKWADGFNEGVRVQFNSGIKEASCGVIENGRIPERGLVIVRWDEDATTTWEKISTLRIIGGEK